MNSINKPIDSLPIEFSSYEEAAHFWDTHDTMDYPDVFETVPVPVSGQPRLVHQCRQGTSLLPVSPTVPEQRVNETTWQAWQEIQAGGGQTFQSVEELFEDLESETLDD